MDTRLGCLSIHLDTPQCFSAEMYSADLNITGKPEDDKVKIFYLLLLMHFLLNEVFYIIGRFLQPSLSRLPVIWWHSLGALVSLFFLFFFFFPLFKEKNNL